MRISDWSSDVCSSDLGSVAVARALVLIGRAGEFVEEADLTEHRPDSAHLPHHPLNRFVAGVRIGRDKLPRLVGKIERSEERRVGNACVSTGRIRWSQYH